MLAAKSDGGTADLLYRNPSYDDEGPFNNVNQCVHRSKQFGRILCLIFVNLLLL